MPSADEEGQEVENGIEEEEDGIEEEEAEVENGQGRGEEEGVVDAGEEEVLGGVKRK